MDPPFPYPTLFRFILDVFPLASRMATLEVSREEEFAPVKNANGTSVDSPDTARVLVSNLCKRWLRDAGAEIVAYDNDELCEVRLDALPNIATDNNVAKCVTQQNACVCVCLHRYHLW